MNKDDTKIIPELKKEWSEDLKLSYQTVDASSITIIISPIGSIHTYNAGHFEQDINKLIDQGYIYLFFDMSNTTYVSALGIGTFLNILNRVKSIGGDIVLDRILPHVLEVFNLPGFSNIFTINGVNSEESNKLGKLDWKLPVSNKK